MEASISEALDSAIINGDETKKKAQPDELNKCSTNIFTLRILLVVSVVLKIFPNFPFRIIVKFLKDSKQLKRG